MGPRHWYFKKNSWWFQCAARVETTDPTGQSPNPCARRAVLLLQSFCLCCWSYLPPLSNPHCSLNAPRNFTLLWFHASCFLCWESSLLPVGFMDIFILGLLSLSIMPIWRSSLAFQGGVGCFLLGSPCGSIPASITLNSTGVYSSFWWTLESRSFSILLTHLLCDCRQCASAHRASTLAVRGNNDVYCMSLLWGLDVEREHVEHKPGTGWTLNKWELLVSCDSLPLDQGCPREM